MSNVQPNKNYRSNIRRNTLRNNNNNRRNNNNSKKTPVKNNNNCRGNNSSNNRPKRRPMVAKITNSMNRMNISPRTHPFLKCRFSTCTMSCHIPDGAGGKCVPMSLYALDTISTTGTTLAFQFNPWLPSPIMLYTTDLITLNGTAITTRPAYNQNGNYFIPLGCPSNVTSPNGSYVPGGNILGANLSADIYSASTIRISGIRFKITNTTAPMFRSGMYQFFQNNMAVTDANLTTESTTAGAGVSTLEVMRYDNTTAVPVLNNGIPLYTADGDLQFRPPTNKVETFTTEKPLEFYLNKTTREYLPIPYSQKNCGIIVGNTNNNLVSATKPYNAFMAATFGSASCINAFDNSFQGSGLIISGLTTTQANTIVVETFVSFELVPHANSTTMAFIKDSPPADPAILRYATQLQNTIPQARTQEPRK